MATKEITFKTLSEARAFCAGVEFVNDSAITITEIEIFQDRHTVKLEDEDESEDERDEISVNADHIPVVYRKFKAGDRIKAIRPIYGYGFGEAGVTMPIVREDDRGEVFEEKDSEGIKLSVKFNNSSVTISCNGLEEFCVLVDANGKEI